MYLSIVYQILSLHLKQLYCGEGYSTEKVQMNAWKGSYTYDNVSSTPNWATQSKLSRISWPYVCHSSRSTIHKDLSFPTMMHILSMIPSNSAVTHLQILNAAIIPCHKIAHNVHTFIHNYDVWICLMQRHIIIPRLSVLHLANTNG
jgi:hypothetical protein